MTRPGSDSAAATNAVVTISPTPASPRTQHSDPRLRRDHVVAGFEEGENPSKLIRSLWEHAPFPRLPADAPPQLQKLVREIEDPCRVYAIHRAARRHGCQALIEQFIVQLRDGCGSKTCSTATCFSYRKRAARTAPIRRFNTTSARALAVHLVCCDNPDTLICPNLRSPKGPPASMQTLKFLPIHGDHRYLLSRAKSRPGEIVDEYGGDTPTPQHDFRPSPPSSPPSSPRLPRTPTKMPSDNDMSDGESDIKVTLPTFRVEEEPVGKDHRSFVANVFDTVAFKMTEWLTRNGIDHIVQQTSDVTATATPLKSTTPTLNSRVPAKPESPSPVPPTGAPEKNSSEARDGQKNSEPARPKTPIDQVVSDKRSSKIGPNRRNSNAKVRTSSVSKAHRKMSLEPFPPPVDDTTPTTKPSLLSPRVGAIPLEKTWPSKTSPVANKVVPETVAFEVPLQDTQLSNETVSKTKPDGAPSDDVGTPGNAQEPAAAGKRTASTQWASKVHKQSSKEMLREKDTHPESEMDPSEVLPQSLPHLSVQSVDFLCNVLADDGTADGPLFDPFFSETLPTLRDGSISVLARTQLRSGRSESGRRRRQWKQFVEQSLFTSLSDPHALVRSFTEDGALLDSSTLWYCMMRLTRTVPSLVFDSLWLAAASLFSPPQSLQTPRSKSRPKKKPLSNADAAHVMSICLHALVAAVPLSDDANARAISELQSKGVILPTTVTKTEPVHALSLQYYDVFSNELALRLARRLFSALSARKYYAEMVDHDDDVSDTAADLDLLGPLFTQLENSDPSSFLTFPHSERSAYETRVPALILHWAKTILLDRWDGQPEFASDGPFGGAMSLMSAMYKQRKPLMVGESLFKIDMFVSHLDAMTMPNSWLTFDESQRRRQHMLDHPFLFKPEALVDYFRAINISRMGDQHLQAEGQKARMMGLDENQDLLRLHHIDHVDELLKEAMDRFLTLHLCREDIVQSAFDQLWRRELGELQLPFKVVFTDEQGADQGGLQVEFFRLAIPRCLDPNYGAFLVDERTRMSWFMPGSVVDLWTFEMIGLLFSLAVYNGLSVPVTFPRALYRKLLDRPVCEIHHIEDGWPELASGLTQLLDWDEDKGLVDDVFMRTYEFSTEAFGRHTSRDMRQSDDPWPSVIDSPHSSDSDAPLVTGANREAYVSDYIRWLTDVSIRPQYEAFERGFRTILHPKSLTLLSPALLQTVVEGVQDVDVSELRRYTKHNCWLPKDRSPDFFWQVVAEYDPAARRRLLEFVTASSRVPTGGMAHIIFILQKNGDDRKKPAAEARVPTASTCFGTLLLPEYASVEVMRQKMAIALDNVTGFALT